MGRRVTAAPMPIKRRSVHPPLDKKWASRTLALPAFREASGSPPSVSSATRTLVPSGVRGNPPDWLRANATAALIRRCGEAGRRIKAERAAKIYSIYNVIGLAKLSGTSAATTPSRDPIILLRAPTSDLSDHAKAL